MMIVQHWCQQQEICAANLPPWGDEGKKICLVSSWGMGDVQEEGNGWYAERKVGVQRDKMEERRKWLQGREWFKKLEV